MHKKRFFIRGGLLSDDWRDIVLISDFGISIFNSCLFFIGVKEGFAVPEFL
jgi:hypothetical protein